MQKSSRRYLPTLPFAAGLAALIVVSAALPAATILAQTAAPPTDVPVVRLAFPQEDGSLTPYTFDVGYPLVTLVYDTLLWRDDKGVPQPLLARSVETSTDGRRVTIRLADDARWHDGTPLTAADVAFTFRYVASHAHRRFTPQLAAVERVDVVDPATVLVHLRHPSAGFADQPLADLPILPAHLWQRLPTGSVAPEGLPIGSGPYRLVEHRQGERYRFQANPDWFRGPPPVKAIEVPIITDAEQTFNALERRVVDMVPLSLPKGIDDRLRTLGTRVVRGTTYVGSALVLNTRRPPFDRVEARRAVAAAIDLVRVSRLVANVVPADRGYLHPQSEWAATAPLHKFDEAAARAAFATLSIPPLTVLAPDNDPVKQEAAREISLALQRAGVKAEPRAVKRDELSRALGEEGGTPTFDAAIGAIPPLASYDPDFLRPLFGSVSGPTAVLNVTGYRSTGFDEVARRISDTPEPEARRAVVGEALRLLATEAPAVPLFFTEGAYVFRPAVFNGWVFVKGHGILDKRSFVDPRRGPDQVATSPQPDAGRRFSLWLVVAALVGVAVVLVVLSFTSRRSDGTSNYE